MKSRYFERDDLDHNLSGKVCLITGGSSGVGKAAAKSFAERGAEVWILSRNREMGLDAVDQLREQTKNHHIELVTLDVSDLEAVKKFCETFPRGHVDILVHNAGIARPRTQFSTSVIGSYLLTVGLLNPLKSSSEGARVIFVSSVQKQGSTVYNDLSHLILAEILSTKFKETGMVFHSMYPGWVDTPGTRGSMQRFYRLTKPVLRTAEQGADTIVWLAICPRVLNGSGQFWLDRELFPVYGLAETPEIEQEREKLLAIISKEAVL